MRDDLSQVSSTLRRNPNGRKRRKGEAPFQSILSATHGYWSGAKRHLSRRAHTSDIWHLLHTTPTPLWTHRVKNKHINLYILYSHAHLWVPPPPNSCVPLHMCSASAPPTLQWTNAFPCSAQPVSKSLPALSIRPTSSAKFRTSPAHTKFLPPWAVQSNKQYLLTASDTFSI